MHFLKLAVAIASLANQSCKACSGWVFAAVEKVFQWTNPAWSDANSADLDGIGAIEQPLEMIKSIGRSHTQTQTQTQTTIQRKEKYRIVICSISLGYGQRQEGQQHKG